MSLIRDTPGEEYLSTEAISAPDYHFWKPVRQSIDRKPHLVFRNRPIWPLNCPLIISGRSEISTIRNDTARYLRKGVLDVVSRPDDQETLITASWDSPSVAGSLRRKHSSGPPLHAKYPGVFDRSGGWRIPIGAHSGVCFGILVHRGLGRNRIEAGEKCMKMEVGGYFNKRLVRFIKFSMNLFWKKTRKKLQRIFRVFIQKNLSRCPVPSQPLSPPAPTSTYAPYQCENGSSPHLPPPLSFPGSGHRPARPAHGPVRPIECKCLRRHRPVRFHNCDLHR